MTNELTETIVDRLRALPPEEARDLAIKVLAELLADLDADWKEWLEVVGT